MIAAIAAIAFLDRSGAIALYPTGFSTVASWVVVGFLALGVVMNAISRSKAERLAMTPVALLLAVFALLVARGLD